MEAIQISTQKSNDNDSVDPEKRVSYRDPAGSVYLSEKTMIRRVSEAFAIHLNSVLKLKVIREWSRQGKLIETQQVSPVEYQHPRIFFRSYPFEWCPEMLYKSAELTLELAMGVLPDGLGLKDASARNILFNGQKPVFIDLLSFEKRHPNDATWMPFEQFLKHFIYPLALFRTGRSSLRSYFLSSAEGLNPTQVAGMMGIKAYFPRYFALIAIPHLLFKWATKRRGQAQAPARFVSSRAEAQFVLRLLFKHLRHGLERVKPFHKVSTDWGAYYERLCPYDPKALENKDTYVEKILKRLVPSSVLDLGCNEGRFSVMAAKLGAKVVGVDSDVSCLSSLWKKAEKENLDILPISMDFNEPSPALGWRNVETYSFLDRAKERFDMTLSLALFHHLILQSLPAEEIVLFIRNTTKRYAVIEYVGPADSQVKEGLSLRRQSIRYPTREEFLAASLEHFTVVESSVLPKMDREIFVFERKA